MGNPTPNKTPQYTAKRSTFVFWISWLPIGLEIPLWTFLNIFNFLLFGETWRKILPKYYREVISKVNIFSFIVESGTWALMKTHDHPEHPEVWCYGVMRLMSANNTMLIGAHERQWVLMITPGTIVPCPWVLMDGRACSCVLMAACEFSWALISAHKHSWADISSKE